MYDLAVLNGRSVLPQGCDKANIYIDGDRIARVTRHEYASERSVDATGLVVLPGLIDLHVHMRDMNLSSKEDFLRGSRAALAGGFTLVGDMPNSDPPTISVRDMDRKLRDASRKSVVDYAIWGGINEDQDALGGLVRSGQIVGMKAYLTEETDRKAFPIAARMLVDQGLPICVHAEDSKKFGAGYAHDAEEYSRLRPVEAEIEAIRWAMSNCGSCRIHLTHISSSAGVRLIKRYKRQGRDLTYDVTPHHLTLFAEKDFKPVGLGKVNPPLRSFAETSHLREEISSGSTLAIASDHAPHTPEEKSRDFPFVPPGIIGLETSLSLVNTYLDPKMDRMQFLGRSFSTFPSHILGLGGRLGRIEEGCIASLTLFDPERQWTIQGRDLHSKSNLTPYEGWDVVGKATRVIVRGTVAYDEGEFLVTPGFGELVTSER